MKTGGAHSGVGRGGLVTKVLRLSYSTAEPEFFLLYMSAAGTVEKRHRFEFD